jgi:hypothetical protein
MTRCIPAFLLTPLLLLACGDLFSPKVTRVWTDAHEYTLTTTSYGYEGRLALSFTNANSFPVTIPGCGSDWGGALERRRPTDGVWVYALGFGSHAKCAGGSVVPPGATRRQVVRFGCSVGFCPYYSQFPESPIAGEYRVVLGVASDLPPEQVTSNTFTLLTSSP